KSKPSAWRDPRAHPGHGPVRAGERLGDDDLVRFRGELLDAGATWLDVHEAQRTHGGSLEVVPPLPRLDERHACARPADRKRKAREARAASEIHERCGSLN